MALIPYLFFDGTCEAALEFYAEVFGGTVEEVMRYGDLPPGEGEVPEGRGNLVMNATFRAGEAVLMASDAMEPGAPERQGVSLYMGFDDIDRARRVFLRLSKGGTVLMPFAPTFWAAGFGRCRDRFGTDWMIGVDAPPAVPDGAPDPA
ncbi:MAG: VOC family protein [Rhodobacteraceae bacterium]|jgi:PhnB protein|nr:VOC family protein [Paracoccaceae bacterium]